MTTKKPTQAARLRAIEQERQRLVALTAPAPAMDEQFEAILGAFVPKAVDAARWNDDLGAFVLDVMRRSQYRGHATFRQALSEFTLYANWAIDQGTPMTMEALLDHTLIERWVQTQRGAGATSTWANRRSRMRNLATHVMPSQKAPRRPEAIGRPYVKAPYTRFEVADLERLALSQPTAAKRRQLCAMVGFGLGAGLASMDLRHLTAGHVHHDLTARYWVDVPGAKPRTVVIRDRYVPFVQEALKGVKDDQLILGREATRKSITGHVVGSAAIGSTTTMPDQARLRSTWILIAMTAPLPLAALLAAAGITSASTLTDLLPYATDPAYAVIDGGADHARI